MLGRRCFDSCGNRYLIIAAVCGLLLGLGSFAAAQTNNNGFSGNNSAVGGVSIDGNGVLSAARTDDLGQLRSLRQQSLDKLPQELNGQVPMRRVSLKGLQAVLEECIRDKKPLPDAVKCLAGLQRINYVFVYPEKQDIVLVGPGEGWKIDERGNVVGISTGRPVMLFDDLLVALRTARDAANGGITCSIDPSKEGLARMSQELPALTRTGEPQIVASGLERALGMQRISVRGVPDTSHFARVLIAADYRMKRIGMALEPSPVRGLPSYMQLVKPGTRAVVSPRFWLEPKYEAVLRDGEGLGFALVGASVKAMTEEDFIRQSGNIEHSGKASAAAQKWTELMTEKYPQLAVAEPIFGELQNCMELAVVGALVAKERLAEKAGNSFPTLLESSELKFDVFNSPKQVDSKASVMKKGRNWIISASGGVAINSWMIADKAKVDASVEPVRAKAAAKESANWWWN